MTRRDGGAAVLGWIVGWSLRSRGVVVVLAAALLAVGATQLRDLPVDTLPEFNPPMVEVQTEALGLSAAEVEQLITVPLEQDLLNGVAWLDTIRSESVPGLSRIEMIFEPGTDLLRARQVVQERLIQAHALPQVSKPPQMLQPLSSTSRVMMIGLTSEKLSPIELSVLARWTLRPRLMGVPGVANVAIWGQRERQLQVQADPEQLRQHGVSLNQIVETAGNALAVSPLTFLEASTPGTGGFVDTPNQRLGIRHVLPIVTPDDLAQVAVDDSEDRGQALRLGDVATVVEDHQPLIGDAVFGERPGLLLVVEKFPGANTREVTHQVDEALAALAPGMGGVEVDNSLFRPASFLDAAVGNLTTALLLGALLLLLVLGVSLFEWRSALVSASAIVLSLAAALTVLWLRQATLNAIVLAGLVMALGAVIDDAVADVDRIAHRLRRHRAEGGDASAARVVLSASLEVRRPVAYATVLLLVAVVPVFFMEGLTGAFLPPLALSFGLAVLASMLVALTVTPVLGLLLLAGAPLERRQPPLARWLAAAYGRTLAPLLRTPGRATLAGTAGLVVMLLGLAAVPLLHQDLAPSFRDTDLLVRLNGAPGTSHPEMTRVTALAGRELRAIPGVEDVGAHVGRAVMSDRSVAVNSAELWISVDPAGDYDRTVAAVREVVDGFPGMDGELLTYPGQRIEQVLGGHDGGIVVRVYGQDLEVLRAKAEEVRRLLAGVDGTANQQVEQMVEEPTLEIEVDLDKAQRVGIKPGDVRRAAATLLSGIQVGSLFEEQKVFDVVVWGAPEVRGSVADLRELLIDLPDDRGQVELGQVADVRIKPALSVIRHDAVSRSIDVTADVGGRDLGAVMADVDQRLDQVQFPLEYHAEVLGDQADRQAAQRRVLAVAAIAAVLGLLLLQAAFASWRLAAAAFLALPAALAGGVAALLAGGGALSLGALTGFGLVAAVAVRNLVLLVSHCQRLELDAIAPNRPALVLRAARERLSPVLVTALATGLVLVPVLVLGNVPGQELLQPMAVVVLGGLVTTTLITLFVVPALYLRFGSGSSGRLDAAQ
jgi:CzcA family heavy metal efflux pump